MTRKQSCIICHHSRFSGVEHCCMGLSAWCLTILILKLSHATNWVIEWKHWEVPICFWYLFLCLLTRLVFAAEGWILLGMPLRSKQIIFAVWIFSIICDSIRRDEIVCNFGSLAWMLLLIILALAVFAIRTVLCWFRCCLWFLYLSWICWVWWLFWPIFRLWPESIEILSSVLKLWSCLCLCVYVIWSHIEIAWLLVQVASFFLFNLTRMVSFTSMRQLIAGMLSMVDVVSLVRHLLLLLICIINSWSTWKKCLIASASWCLVD